MPEPGVYGLFTTVNSPSALTVGSSFVRMELPRVRRRRAEAFRQVVDIRVLHAEFTVAPAGFSQTYDRRGRVSVAASEKGRAKSTVTGILVARRHVSPTL